MVLNGNEIYQPCYQSPHGHTYLCIPGAPPPPLRDGDGNVLPLEFVRLPHDLNGDITTYQPLPSHVDYIKYQSPLRYDPNQVASTTTGADTRRKSRSLLGLSVIGQRHPKAGVTKFDIFVDDASSNGDAMPAGQPSAKRTKRSLGDKPANHNKENIINNAPAKAFKSNGKTNDDEQEFELNIPEFEPEPSRLKHQCSTN